MDRREIARERIEILLQLAEKHKHEEERARRYVELAFRIAKRNRMRIPKTWKRKFCRRCFTFWVPGENLRVRIASKPRTMLVYVCLRCGATYRFPVDKPNR